MTKAVGLPTQKCHHLEFIHFSAAFAYLKNFIDGLTTNYTLFRPHEGIDCKTPAEAAGITPPLRNWREVAEKVRPINSPRRPKWHTRDDKPVAKKEFQVISMEVAEEAMRPLRPKAFKSAFKTRREF